MSFSASEIDVVIVGAGPAGSTAAGTLARAALPRITTHLIAKLYEGFFREVDHQTRRCEQQPPPSDGGPPPDSRHD